VDGGTSRAFTRGDGGNPWKLSGKMASRPKLEPGTSRQRLFINNWVSSENYYQKYNHITDTGVHLPMSYRFTGIDY
jgi:hypothetical protein